MRAARVASFWIVVTAACGSESDLFVKRVWGESEAAILVAVTESGERTPIAVAASAGVREATFEAEGDVTYYAQTFEELEGRDVSQCTVTFGPNDDLALGTAHRSWIGQRDGDAIQWSLEEVPRAFDLRIRGCERPRGSCDVGIELLDGGPSVSGLFATAVLDDDTALFAGARRGDGDMSTLTMRYDRGTVSTLPPDPNLIGKIQAVEYDGDRIIAAQGDHLLQLDRRGVVTASVAVGFAIEAMEIGSDGAAFLMSSDGELAFVAPGTLRPTAFAPPRYGELTGGEVNLDVVDADTLVLLGPDGSVWHYTEEKWTLLLERVEARVIATDGRDVLLARNNASVLIHRLGGSDWEGISVAFNQQNAIHAEAIGGGRFIITGQTGTVMYYDGAMACTVPSATDRNIEDFDLSPSGDVAFAVGEHFSARDRPTLIMRLAIPRLD